MQQVLDLIASCRFDYILIEASGICEPMPIAQAILRGDDVMPEVCRLDGIVSVVDARRMADEFLNGASLLDQEEDDVAALIVQQIEFCTTIVLNKVSEVEREQLEELKAVIRRLQPEARILETDFGRVPVADVLDTRDFDFSRTGSSAGWIRILQEEEIHTLSGEHHEHEDHDGGHGGERLDCGCHGHCHGHHHHAGGHGSEYGISSFVYFRRQGFDREAFERFVQMEWPASVIRCKGWLWYVQDRSMSYLFEQAGKLVRESGFGRWMACAAPEEQKAARMRNSQLDRNWDDVYGDRMIRLVFIGRYMDVQAICTALDACLSMKR